MAAPTASGNAGLSSYILTAKRTLVLKGWVEDGTLVNGDIDVEISIYYMPPPPPRKIIAEGMGPPTKD